jgi:hypothetical protein
MREHAYEIPSGAIAAYWWTKHYLPKLLERAKEAHEANMVALAKCNKAVRELEELAREAKGGEQRAQS